MSPSLAPSNPQSFPSYKKFYNEFDNKRDNCDSECKQNIGSVLQQYTTKGVKKDETEKRVCCASNNGGRKELDWETSQFLYYHVGNTLPESLEDADFRGLLKMLCSKINDTYRQHGPKIPCDSIPKELFNNRKKIHDYYYDYSAIEGDIQNNGIPNCKEDKWTTYLNSINAACRAAGQGCEAGKQYDSDKYCSDFNSKYRAYCEKIQLSKEKCTLESQLTSVQEEKARAEQAEKSALSEKQSISTKLNNAIHQANKASSLSSAFGTLALMELPAALFLLYKYKPWSFWFGNQTSGNGRRSRSNRRKRRSTGENFDVSAEETFTEYSTDNSTIGDSTTADDSTTLRSRPAHTRQSIGPSTNREGRVRANNNTPGHHRNN
ncbi:KIR-like protein, partial [Plasmodium coatneyi]